MIHSPDTMGHASSVYPTPAGVPASTHFAVTVNGEPSFTYETRSPSEAEFTAGHTVSWTGFAMDAPCEVRIRRLDRDIETVVVRPKSQQIATTIDADEIVLHLDRPCKLSIECNGDLTDVLFLFANEPETDIPLADAPGVVWFGPGVHEIGKFYELNAATTYYLAPGAFLKGSFAGGGDGTRVIGRGILSGAEYDWPGHLQEASSERVDLVKIIGDRVEVSGITLVDSPYYVLIVRGVDAQLRDLKIMAWYHNTDGITAGPGARIDDCFLRVADDAFKPFVSDTQIRRCVLWIDRAAAFQLTWNARQDSGGSWVHDCDVIHHMPFCVSAHPYTGAVFWSWHGGSGHIHDLLFEDIRVEGQCPFLINLFLDRNPWSPQDGSWGRFSRLQFRNIQMDEPTRFTNRLLGLNDVHSIEDVVFENLQIDGHRIDSPEAMNLETNAHVRHLQFRSSLTDAGEHDA